MELDFPRLLCIEASAGSGKTYNLAKRFIILLSYLLSERYDKNFNEEFLPPKSLNSIIALTFTNKAACEMKDRILKFLKILGKVQKGYLNQEEFCLNERQALRLLCDIINNQSDFNITTIDAFINKILRALSIDVGINPDYDITFNQNDIFDLALLELLSDRSIIDDLTSALSSLLQTDNKGINSQKIISRAIYNIKNSISKNFVSGLDIDLLTNKDVLLTYSEFCNPKKLALDIFLDKDFYSEDFETIKKKVEEEIEFFAKKVELIIQRDKESERVLNQNKIRPFKDISIENINKKYDNYYKLLYPKDNIKPSLDSLCKENKKLSLEDEANFINSIKSICKLYSYFIILKNLKENSAIFNILEKFLEKERDIKSHLNIVDGNQITDEVLKILEGDRGVSDIFCKLGERLSHYLIDEFQDTSLKQFNAIYPLIDNALSEGGSLFVVGDKKQAIYAWRGGDYTIFDSIKESLDIKSQVITNNYRSSKNVIEFNNYIFNNIANNVANIYKPLYKSLQNELAKVYSNTTQECIKSSEGYVEVKISANEEEIDKEEFYKRNTIDTLKKLINELHINPSNIMILLRKNEHIDKVVNWLRKEMPDTAFITEESLTLINNFEIKRLLTLALAIVYKDDKSYNQALNELNLDVDLNQLRTKCLGLPPYEFFSYLLSLNIFDYKNNIAYFYAFLEKVLELTNEKKSIEDVIETFYKDKDISISIPKNIEAIKIMTIHKAKGLECHSVIIPFYDWPMVSNNLSNLYGIFNIKGLKCLEGCDRLIFAKVDKKLRTILEDADLYFRANKKSNIIESTNLMYVANTRAIKNLFIFGYLNKKKEYASNLLFDILKDKLNQDEDKVYSYKIGDIETVDLTDQNKDISKTDSQISSDISCSLRQYLKIYPNSYNLQLDRYKRDFGNLYHTAMSFINKIDKGSDINHIAQLAYKKAMEITKIEDESVINSIIKTLSDLKDYFLDIDMWWNEKELVDKNGNILRIDRLVQKKGQFYLIEYKTGIYLKSHKKQLTNYLKLFNNAKGLLYYVDTGEIIRL